MSIIALDGLAAAGGPSSPAWTLAVAAIGALATVAGILVKAFLDRRAESAKQKFDLLRLELELGAQRGDVLREQTRKVCAEFLAHTQEMYSHVRKAREGRRQDGDEEAYRMALAVVSPDEAQVMLEEIRLVASEPVVQAASAMWEHLRAPDLPSGRDARGATWVAWKSEYWRQRKHLVAVLRSSLAAP